VKSLHRSFMGDVRGIHRHIGCWLVVVGEEALRMRIFKCTLLRSQPLPSPGRFYDIIQLQLLPLPGALPGLPKVPIIPIGAQAAGTHPFL
jgi:hypothetical protein